MDAAERVVNVVCTFIVPGMMTVGTGYPLFCLWIVAYAELAHRQCRV